MPCNARSARRRIPQILAVLRCLTPLPHLDETLIADPEAVLHPREKPKLKSVCAGRYEIVQELGGGGMGQVYKARDNKLHRYVALKFLIPRLSGDKDAKLRFIQEAQAASGLDHQNIYTIYEIDETPTASCISPWPFMRARR